MTKNAIVSGMKSSVIQAPWDEFRHQYHDDRDTGDERAKSVDQRAFHPMRAAIFPPVHNHAGLRKRERQESAHGVERDEPVGDAAEKDQKAAAKHRQTTMP